MTIVGFNFTKMFAEKKSGSDPNVRVENNVGITNVTETSMADPNKSIIRYEFNFVCKYEPGVGKIELTGELIELYEKKYAIQLLEDWNKNKKLNKELMTSILNNVLSRANIQAVIISKDMGLPPPIAMPRVEVRHVAVTPEGTKPATTTPATTTPEKTEKPATETKKKTK